MIYRQVIGYLKFFSPSFTYFQVTYIGPGQSSEIETKDGSKIRIKATAGPVLGPPWQRPENGYTVEVFWYIFLLCISLSILFVTSSHRGTLVPVCLLF